MYLLYIVTEGSIICQLPQEKILDAVLGLLGFFCTSIMYTCIHPMQGNLGFSRADIAWNWVLADFWHCFLLLQWLGKCLSLFVRGIYLLRTENNFENWTQTKCEHYFVTFHRLEYLICHQGQYASTCIWAKTFLLLYNFDLFFLFFFF